MIPSKINDELGNVFNTIEELCDCWEVKVEDLQKIIDADCNSEDETKGYLSELLKDKKRVSISKIMFKQRTMELNWSVKKAITTPVGCSKSVFFKDKEYTSLANLCKELKISYRMARYNMRIKKLSFNESINREIIRTAK